MIDFKELDEKYMVYYNKKKFYDSAILFNKEDWNHIPNVDDRWISISRAYDFLKKEKKHFRVEGNTLACQKAGFMLNETFGHCTFNLKTLYVIGKIQQTKWEPVESVGDVIDSDIDLVNRERKLANYMLGYIDYDTITDDDAFPLDKDTLKWVLDGKKEEWDTID